MSKDRSVSKLGSGAVAALASAALVVPAVPALASTHQAPTVRAVSIEGVVVARQFARRAVAVASAKGVVSTLRLASAREVASLHLGTEVRARALHLGDGTFHAARVRSFGHVGHARVHATVVSSSARHLLLSAGGSVFSLVPRAKTFRSHLVGSSDQPGTGTVVTADVTIAGSSIEETDLQSVGQSDLIDLEGHLSSVSSSQIVLAVDEGALTTISIPASMSLPSTIAVGDEVEILASYSNQAFSLVTITDDSVAAKSSDGEGDSQSNDGQLQSLEAEGSVVSVTQLSLVVQPGEGSSPVTFVVPAGFDLTGVVAGAQVDAKGDLVNGVLTLQSIDVQNDQGDQQSTGGTSSGD